MAVPTLRTGEEEERTPHVRRSRAGTADRVGTSQLSRNKEPSTSLRSGHRRPSMHTTSWRAPRETPKNLTRLTNPLVPLRVVMRDSYPLEHLRLQSDVPAGAFEPRAC